ncbi:MAG: SDR family oxidoreductase [Pseudomonadota bacterium]
MSANALADKVAVITGAASGIGWALVEALVAQGAKVVASDINEENLARVESEIGGVEISPCDVTSGEQMQALVDQVREKYGRIDLFFNNAGIAISGDARDLEFEHWTKVIDVNLNGVMYGSQAAYKVMAEQGEGHIVNIASLAGLIPYPSNAPYAASKHAVVGLSMSLRAEGHDLGVRVSAVCPGYIESNIYQATEMLKLDREKALKSLPFKMVPAPVAANKILDGVINNRAIIVFPGYAKIFYWLQRWVPVSMHWFGLTTMREVRKLRSEKNG